MCAVASKCINVVHLAATTILRATHRYQSTLNMNNELNSGYWRFSMTPIATGPIDIIDYRGIR